MAWIANFNINCLQGKDKGWCVIKVYKTQNFERRSPIPSSFAWFDKSLIMGIVDLHTLNCNARIVIIGNVYLHMLKYNAQILILLYWAFCIACCTYACSYSVKMFQSHHFLLWQCIHVFCVRRCIKYYFKFHIIKRFIYSMIKREYSDNKCHSILFLISLVLNFIVS